MRNNFLCTSIIIMLNTIFVKRCTCRFDDVRTSSYSDITNTQVIMNNSNDFVADRTSICDVIHNKSYQDTCERLNSAKLINTLLYTTDQWGHKTRKCVKRKQLTTTQLENTMLKTGKQRRTSTDLPSQTISNGSSCVLNFKFRKKADEKHCIPNSVLSSPNNSFGNATQVSTWFSLMNYINSGGLENKSHYLTQRLKKNRKKQSGDLETNNLLTIEKPKRTRRRKSSSTCDSNSTSNVLSKRSSGGLNIPRKSRGKLVSSNNETSARNSKTKRKLNEKNATDKIHKSHGKSSNSNRKLLRKELIELLRNQSYRDNEPERKNLFAKTTCTTVSPPVQIIPLNGSSSVSTETILFPVEVHNFLYSEENKVDVAYSGNESILNEFDEIRLNPVNSVAEKLNMQHSHEKFLYVPRNDSVRWFAHFTPEHHTAQVKRKTLIGKSTAKSKSQVGKLKYITKKPSKALVLDSKWVLEKKDITKKRRRSTHFDMYDFFLHQKPYQHHLLKPKSTLGIEKNKLYQKSMPATKANLKRKGNLNWKQFTMSPEEINLEEEGPTVNVFSETQEEKQVVNSSETTYPPMVTLSFKELPDTKECDQLWNHTFLMGTSNDSIKINRSNEICTFDSVEALHVIRHNFSGLLTTKSFLSGLSPFHQLLHPFVTKFDDSILPKAKEAKDIFAKYFNESIQLDDDPDVTKSKEDETTVCPLEQLNEFDFSDMSLSYEWKMMFERARRTTHQYTDMTDLPIELPDTKEAESVLHQFSWPNLFKTLASRQNHFSTGTPRISTLSLHESKLLFARLGVELFGQEFRININHRDQKKKHKVLLSRTKNKMPERVLKNKKVEGYVMKMITEVSPDSGDQEDFVPWQSEESGGAVQLNFDMKLFLSKLCTYLSHSKHKNETHELPATKNPQRSFLIGKPAYFKKRKNALI